jgi:signal transduction histidine kinase
MPIQPDEEHYRSLFEEAPVALWEADFSAVKALLGHLREMEGQDLRSYLADHPEVVDQCLKLVRIKDVNRATLAMFCAARKDTFLGDFSPLVRASSHDTLREQLAAIVEGKTSFEGRAVVQAPSGDEKQVLFSWSVAADCAKTYSRVLVSAIDITEIKRAEDTLLRHTSEMQGRIEELDDFAHTVAHDLKNPLTSIIGYAEAMEEHFDAFTTEQKREYLRSIAWSGRKMTSIIQELLLLASVRKAEIETMPLDMARIVGQALQRLVYMIEQQQARVVVPDSWPLVQGYAAWVEEVWVNYLSNAVKYGGKPPQVELGVTAQGDMARFWVRDNGPGIVPESMPRLFKPFSRLDHLRVEGHGLGLSIVRHIVEKLGGQVGAHSEIGRGSTFYFTLPVVRLDGL